MAAIRPRSDVSWWKLPVRSISPGRASSWARVRADNLPCTARAISAGRSAERALNDTMALVIKNKLFTRAVEQRQPQLVQQGYIVAWAVSEVAALLGLLDFYVTGNRYYYVLFIIAACTQLLHFPRREHVMNASFKSSI